MAKRSTNGNIGGDGATIWEKMRAMRASGVEQTIPSTGRVVKLRTVEPAALLRGGDVPDILTPLVIRGVYQELSDGEIREFLDAKRERLVDAIAYADSLDLIARTSIAYGPDVVGGVDVGDLSVAEKRWIFRLALSPAELLVTFRYEPPADVEPVDEGEDLPQAAE